MSHSAYREYEVNLSFSTIATLLNIAIAKCIQPKQEKQHFAPPFVLGLICDSFAIADQIADKQDDYDQINRNSGSCLITKKRPAVYQYQGNEDQLTDARNNHN